MKKQDLLVTNKTQYELADILGVNQSLISKWFSGKVIPRPSTIHKICKACDLSYEEFISFIYEKHKRLNEDKLLD
jgi:transcriptional regulator with XRE-family HTH domain